ncbi:hypothetical protein [Endozoicomonas euniceicola]|uniref:Uncharacterized protein n=1 Tax=Endozoicomonas euniceicola TaxID=1234143 RepID=A0ABY6GUB7_9GAMM|nr:hypothetical protein [Endozoicomonas euniceicola]UYM15984.1 hypothetical protein NX720_24745 [Endozoicomonas euniceicola]
MLGSELHYQAMIYHCLRTAGAVPIDQLGMNVKIWISNPISPLFQALDKKKHEDYQGGFEPIPDIVIFSPEIRGDWRRRNRKRTLVDTLLAIEVKASERANGRLRPGEIISDIEKLAAHREEVRHHKKNMYPVMLVIDSTPEATERMTNHAIDTIFQASKKLDVGLLFCSDHLKKSAIR